MLNLSCTTSKRRFWMLTLANSAPVDNDAAKAYAKFAIARVELIHGHEHESYFEQADACREAYLSFLAGLDTNVARDGFHGNNDLGLDLWTASIFACRLREK